jgi:hypothetical protein
MIIAGHRRCAAVLSLLKEGFPGIGQDVSCKIKHYVASDGKSIEEIEILDLILSNEQRESYTIEEKLWKLEKLYPIVKKEYDKGLINGTISGAFRHYFAPFMGMSSSALQRLESLKNLSQKAKSEVDAGNMTVTAAAELVSLDATEQDKFLESSLAQGSEVTVKTVKMYKAALIEPKQSLPESFVLTEENVDKTTTVPIPKSIDLANEEQKVQSPIMTEIDLEDKGQEPLFVRPEKLDEKEQNNAPISSNVAHIEEEPCTAVKIGMDAEKIEQEPISVKPPILEREGEKNSPIPTVPELNDAEEVQVPIKKATSIDEGKQETVLHCFNKAKEFCQTQRLNGTCDTCFIKKDGACRGWGDFPKIR